MAAKKLDVFGFLCFHGQPYQNILLAQRAVAVLRRSHSPLTLSPDLILDSSLDLELPQFEGSLDAFLVVRHRVAFSRGAGPVPRMYVHT